ncbi:histone-lysine N-methyltransferase EHMT2 [Diabrotica undecimpunctata]|uniref:histone-lysine N-methyltransferase EHMT2 n=1 Tax=Diabrotica undecimpunctata TaxID=50387 RepID=UPI003B635972
MTTNDNKSYSQYDNNFIDKLLGEMKNTFNRTDSVRVELKNEESAESVEMNSEETVTSPKKSKTGTPGRRSSKQKVDEKTEESTKRSSRRMKSATKKSVLQNAIARKKSYNEPTRQRLTRQLKPTQKVLENIAQAKDVVKRVKMKDNAQNNNHLGEGNSKKTSTTPKKNQKGTKMLKIDESDEDSQSDLNCSEDDFEVDNVRSIRKSRRLSNSPIKKVAEATPDPAPNIADQVEDIPGHPSTTLMRENPELALRLCLCTQKTHFYVAEGNSEDIVYCSAVDSIDDKLVGCSREVTVNVSSLIRPSRRVPYMSLCELHKNRMIRHNCCPTCGIFCTQGKFVQCESNHQFHEKCRLLVGSTECCPHCGTSSPSRDLLLKFKCTKNPVFLPTQKSKGQTAKMTFSKAKDQIRSSTPLLIPLDSFQSLETLADGATFTENDILDAVSEDDNEKLMSIIASTSVDLNFKLDACNSGTLLHYAAHKGWLKMCHLLVSLGLHINEIDGEQNTPLMLAIIGHKIDIVQYLVRAGADIALKGTDGMTALHVSSKCGNLQACKILLEAGASIKKYIDCQDDGGWTPLVWACENGFSEITDFLIGQGADHRLRDVEYNEALHWAAFSGCSHIVELLLNRGCDINTVNAHGETPLHIAAREDRYNSVIVLLARGANVFLVNKNDETPLNCVPEDGMCHNPIALNMQLQSLVNPSSRLFTNIVAEDISKGRESNPVQCINAVDDDLEPKDYVYITKSIISSESIAIKSTPSSLQRCTCDERCTGEDCLCGTLSVKCWYDEDGKVFMDFKFSDTPILFECSDTCTCNAITCRNRVVQRGTQHRFQLYKTDSKGWGVKTLRLIERGHFVCEYVGEILTDSDADHREDDSFVFDLGTKDTDNFCVDAKFYGNLTRFINHSCNPNLHPVKVFVDHQDVRFPRIAFFALRDIRAEEELSFDYGRKFWIAKYKSFSCQCGSDHCRYSNEAIKRLIDEEVNLKDEDSLSS